jgi:hypothetical protein
MGSRYQIGGWPARPNIFGNVAQVHALGQITLSYNHLESMLALIFQDCMPMEEDSANQLFHKLNNRDRIDLLVAIIRSSDFHSKAKDALNHLFRCYDICTENRNILLHATHDESYAGVLHISKKSSNNPAVVNRFKIPLADLRLVAEQMSVLSDYIFHLLFWLKIRGTLPKKYKSSLRMPPLKKIPYPKLRRVLRAVPEISTLPEKPPKPRKLTPYQPPATRQVGKRPPQSSQA